MNGFEFVREARKINPKVKILLMTAFEIDEIRSLLGFSLIQKQMD
jgi:hypothetical protein